MKKPNRSLPEFVFRHVGPRHKDIDEKLSAGKNVLLHCVGGLGRSGLVAASYLKSKFDISSDEAISLVRQFRSERAVENRLQEDFVREY